MDRRSEGAVAALTAAALWGGMYVVSKDTFDSIPPITLGALRLLLAGAALATALRLRRRLRWPGDRGLLLAGPLLAGTLIVQFIGTDLATASAGALLTTTTPLWLVPLGWVFLGERPGLGTLAGIAVGMAGVALAVGGGGMSLSPWGPALLLLSAAGWAGYTIAAAPASRRHGPLVAVTWATLLALPIVGGLSLLEVERWSAEALSEPATVAAVAYLGFAASAGAWYLWNRGVTHLPAAVAGAFFFVQPVVGGILARALLGERLDALFVVGGILILLGVLLALGSASAVPNRKEEARVEIVNPQIEEYMEGLLGGDHPVADEMEAEADERDFPIVGRPVGVTLEVLARAVGASRILEMGSGYGYSAYWFALAVGPGGEVHMTEGDSSNQDRAMEYLGRAELADRVHSHVGNALDIIDELDGDFDVIFCDIDKGDYPAAWAKARERIRVGGLYLCDNVLWSGRVVTGEDRQNTPAGWTAAVQEHNAAIASDERFRSTIVPTRDGVMVAVRVS